MTRDKDKELWHSRAYLQRRQWHPTPVLMPGKSMDGGASWAAVHGVANSWTQLSNFTFTFYFHALEKEMATHSSVLAWRIPGMGKTGGLLSMGSHRVGHDWSNLAAAAAAAGLIWTMKNCSTFKNQWMWKFLNEMVSTQSSLHLPKYK